MNQIDNKIRKFQRATRLIFVFFLFLIIILVWFFSRAYFSINVSPNSVTVLVDNSPVRINRSGHGRIFSSPGDHTVKIESDGYIGTTREITFKRGFTTKLDVSLKEMPKQELLESSGKFLSRGKESNEFLYLGNGGTTLIRATVNSDNNGGLTISKQALTDKRLSGISEIVWSPNNDLALFRVGDRINIFDFQKYDFVNQTETLFGQNIGSFAWAPDNSKIAYYYAPPGGEKSLIFSNFDNSEQTRFLNLNDDNLKIEDPLLKWSPDSRWLLLIPRGKQYDQNKIYLLDTYSKLIKVLTTNGDQINASFSPDGSKIVYSTYSFDISGGAPYLLSIMDQNGENQRSLGLRVDLDKTIWDIDSKNLILTTTNSQLDTNYISVYNTGTVQKNSDFLSLSGNQKVLLLQISSDGKIITYQTGNGIYASPFEE